MWRWITNSEAKLCGLQIDKNEIMAHHVGGVLATAVAFLNSHLKLSWYKDIMHHIYDAAHLVDSALKIWVIKECDIQAYVLSPAPQLSRNRWRNVLKHQSAYWDMRLLYNSLAAKSCPIINNFLVARWEIERTARCRFFQRQSTLQIYIIILSSCHRLLIFAQLMIPYKSLSVWGIDSLANWNICSPVHKPGSLGRLLTFHLALCFLVTTTVHAAPACEDRFGQPIWVGQWPAQLTLLSTLFIVIIKLLDAK